MPPPDTLFHLNAAHVYRAAADDTDAELRGRLKQQYGIDARRLSRFTQLVLLGALPLQNGLPPDTAVHLASPFSSPGKIIRLREKLYRENLPSPLDFMANLHNAATFHLMQALGCHGNSVFAAADAGFPWSPLYPALNHLLAHPDHSVLLGWAYEAQQPGESEGSLWWHLSRRQSGGDIARLRWTSRTEAAPPPAADGAFFDSAFALHRLAAGHGLTLPSDGIFPALQIRPSAT
ncbi:MAG: hypothetical protein Q4A62_03010 [Eikenella sp.]|nr:hypothetical protein [Eikenella sp.]